MTIKVYQETKLGSILRKYIALRGRSMHSLAKEIGVTAEAIRKLANGKSMSTYFEKELCDALDIPMSEMDALNIIQPSAGGQPKRIQDNVHFFKLGKKQRARSAKNENFMDFFEAPDGDGHVKIGLHISEDVSYDEGSYAIRIPDDAMAPSVKARDIVIALTGRAPVKGSLVIVEYQEGDDLVACVRKYNGVEDGDLRVYQTNPMQEMRIKEEDVVRVIYAEVAKMIG